MLLQNNILCLILMFLEIIDLGYLTPVCRGEYLDLRGRKWQEASLLSNGYRGALSLVVKRPGREAGHLPPSSAEIKDCVELYFHSPNTISWRGAQFKKRTETTLLSLS
jgi:hypothetical protein